MKITVRVNPSETIRHIKFNLSDYDVTDEQWEKMTETERNEKLQELVDDEPEHPYWVVDNYDETYN